ncbi:sulfur carrier protein ThiS [Kineococcus glutinatus]|uniref:Sulfur carrier protein ThiS n=1 Tax=Kineococcus glutinatus TaxID=1070872 RepID=A0ABP8VIZ9_9ACTN
MQDVTTGAAGPAGARAAAAVRFTLNGEVSTAPAGTSVAGVVAGLLGTAAREGIAVAANDEVVPRSRWAQHPVADGDRLEVLDAVAGG